MSRTYLPVIFLCALGSHASAISYTALPGQTGSPVGVTFTATGGVLGTKTLNGTTGLGVVGGGAKEEINKGESLTLTFDTAQYFTSINLGTLFDGPEHGDEFETAGLLVNGSYLFQLKATGEDTAVWSIGSTTDQFTSIWTPVSGTVSNLSLANALGGGNWSVFNPFGNLAVETLTLLPIIRLTPGNGSDFTLTGFETQAVPDSGSTVALLGASMIGMALLRSKRLAASGQ